jgi:hypothetical protein
MQHKSNNNTPASAELEIANSSQNKKEKSPSTSKDNIGSSENLKMGGALIRLATQEQGRNTLHGHFPIFSK